MNKRTKKVKARLTYGDNGFGWTIPRTAEAYDAMVEQMKKSLMSQGYILATWHGLCEVNPAVAQELAVCALRAIGITRPKEQRP